MSRSSTGATGDARAPAANARDTIADVNFILYYLNDPGWRKTNEYGLRLRARVGLIDKQLPGGARYSYL
jgi:hypothetical protein